MPKRKEDDFGWKLHLGLMAKELLRRLETMQESKRMKVQLDAEDREAGLRLLWQKKGLLSIKRKRL